MMRQMECNYKDIGKCFNPTDDQINENQYKKGPIYSNKFGGKLLFS